MEIKTDTIKRSRYYQTNKQHSTFKKSPEWSQVPSGKSVIYRADPNVCLQSKNWRKDFR